MNPLISDRRRRVFILPWERRELKHLSGAGPYDALLASVGYEPRSRSITRWLGELPEEAVAVEFEHPQTKSYRESHEWFSKRDVQITQDWKEQFLPWLSRWLRGVESRHDGARVAIDISSMNRPRIAAVVQALAEMPPEARISVDLLYAPSRYSPPREIPDGVLTLQPVSSYLAGQLRPQGSPTALVGLGYEPYKAAGTFDSLEIRDAVLFVPKGPHEDFHDAVLRANEGLRTGPDDHSEVDYEVLDPFDCVMRLEGRVQGLLRDGEVPALVPLGPKIFALCSCLVAAMHQPRVSVWRASFDRNEPAEPRKDQGWVCGITVALSPTPPSRDEIDSREPSAGP